LRGIEYWNKEMEELAIIEESEQYLFSAGDSSR
jgi:hypothetical protein